MSWWPDFVDEIARMHIPRDGATLLATVYPIGVLAAIVEVRSLKFGPRRPPKGRRWGTHSRASLGAIATLSFPAFTSIYWLVGSVVSHVDLRGWIAALTLFFGSMLFFALVPLMIELVSLAWKEDTEETSAGLAAVPPQPAPKAKPAALPNPKPRRRKRRK